MIKSFSDKQTQLIFHGRRSRRLPGEIQQRAFRKLVQLDGAESLDDLRIPPSNHLEMLRGDRAGEHSIRINRQWRICFVWKDRDAYAVEITDYH